MEGTLSSPFFFLFEFANRNEMKSDNLILNIINQQHNYYIYIQIKYLLVNRVALLSNATINQFAFLSD